MEIYTVDSLEEFKDRAKQISDTLKVGDIVILNGELGAGKTTFVKVAAKNLGVLKEVTSPTFTFMKEYKGKYNIFHFDLYRASSEEEVYELGLNEFLYKEGICFIEWNKFTNIDRKVITINIKKEKKEDSRIIEVIR